MNDHLRQTGRTMRLLEKSIWHAERGLAVYVFMPTADMCKEMRHRLERMWAAQHTGQGHGIQFESMQHWEAHRLWDWNTMEPLRKNFHPNCVWLVDHTCVERHLEQVHADIKYLAKLAGQLYPHTI